MRRLLVLSATATALSLGVLACGGDDAPSGSTTPADQGAPDGSAQAPPRTTAPNSPSVPSTPGQEATPQPRPGLSLALPAGVPTTPVRNRTSDEDRRVIETWLRALRAGDVEKAASYFAQPSTVQNGTPVLTLDSPVERVAFNEALPCGAKGTRYGSRDGYTVMEFELTDRPGGDCGSATGQSARGAIKVDDGKITEWYRLADDPAADPSQPPLTPRAPQIDPGSTSEA